MITEYMLVCDKCKEYMPSSVYVNGWFTRVEADDFPKAGTLANALYAAFLRNHIDCGLRFCFYVGEGEAGYAYVSYLVEAGEFARNYIRSVNLWHSTPQETEEFLANLK